MCGEEVGGVGGAQDNYVDLARRRGGKMFVYHPQPSAPPRSNQVGGSRQQVSQCYTTLTRLTSPAKTGEQTARAKSEGFTV